MSDEWIISGAPPTKGYETKVNGVNNVQAMRLVTVGTVTYIGKAPAGTATSTAGWQVQKIDKTSGTVITWADGGNFTQIFDNYESLTYS